MELPIEGSLSSYLRCCCSPQRAGHRAAAPPVICSSSEFLSGTNSYLENETIFQSRSRLDGGGMLLGSNSTYKTHILHEYEITSVMGRGHKKSI
jgi:hypothetical protein